MFKINTKKIAVIAIFMALGVVFKTFSIGNGEFRISIWELPLFLAGMLVGPFYGGICALGADLIYGLIFSPFPFSFIMMFTTIVWGVAGGLFYNKKLDKLFLIAVVFMTALLATGINTVYLILYYGLESALAMLPIRVAIALVKSPVTAILVFILYSQFLRMKLDQLLNSNK